MALAAALGIAPLTASAATISVTTTADTATSSACTLRDALNAMNNAADTVGCVHTGPAFGTNDTIVFDTAAFANGTDTSIVLTGGQLVITDSDLSIDASANSNVTIDANDASRILHASAGGTLNLRHLTLRNGNATGADCVEGVNGGAICILSRDLSLSHVTVTGNEAYFGGGLYAKQGSVTLTNSTVSGNSAEYGGGIYVQSVSTTLTESTLSENTASGYGGGIRATFGTLTLTDSTLSGNTAYDGGGIAVNHVPTTLIDSTLSGNTASGEGGGIRAAGSGVLLSLIRSTLTYNTASAEGGAAYQPSSITSR